jgi:RND family efflux transporter MFP subunit
MGREQHALGSDDGRQAILHGVAASAPAPQASVDSPRRLSRRRLLGGALAGAILASGCGLLPKEEEVNPTPIPTPAETTKAVYEVKRGDLVETIIVNARLTAAQEAVLYFKAQGRLKSLTVASGDTVKAGTIMAQLEVGDLDTRVALAEITARKAQIKLEQARAKGADRFEIQMAQLDYESARLSYDNLKQQLLESQLIAPFDGLVTETQGRPGEIVQGYIPVITVSNPTELQISAELTNEGDSTRLAIGQKAFLVLDKLPNEKLPAELVQLPNTSATTLDGKPLPAQLRRTFKLNPTAPLPKIAQLGMLGRLTLILREKKDVLILPNAAIRAFGGRRYVQITTAGRKREIDIEIGIVTQTETEITKGLKEGDRVIGQ